VHRIAGADVAQGDCRPREYVRRRAADRDPLPQPAARFALQSASDAVSAEKPVAGDRDNDRRNEEDTDTEQQNAAQHETGFNFQANPGKLDRVSFPICAGAS
jgi:hypothetical protein